MIQKFFTPVIVKFDLADIDKTRFSYFVINPP